MPEVSLVAILDADQEGFLRSDRSLIQTIGRAARHLEGRAILYADRITGSMARALEETTRRRAMQDAHNRAHGIVPAGVRRSVDEVKFITRVADARQEREAERGARAAARPVERRLSGEAAPRTREELEALVPVLEGAMREAAVALDFEAAARLRDQLFEVRTALGDTAALARGNSAPPVRPPGSAPGAPGAPGAPRRGGGRRGR
jgi:excinuclease ABC subunit B